MGVVFKIAGNKSGGTVEGGLKRTEPSINKTQEEKKDFWKPSDTADFMSCSSRNTLYNKDLKRSLLIPHFYILSVSHKKYKVKFSQVTLTKKSKSKIQHIFF